MWHSWTNHSKKSFGWIICGKRFFHQNILLHCKCLTQKTLQRYFYIVSFVSLVSIFHLIKCKCYNNCKYATNKTKLIINDNEYQYINTIGSVFISMRECTSFCPCAFLGAHICAKSSSPPWTSISPSTDDHLQAILRVSAASSLKPAVAQLCERKCCQVSGSKE